MAELAMSPSADLDEQTIAATELKSAEDQLRSLCATHASTFVAVERRGAAFTESLKTLLGTLDGVLPQVEESKNCLEFDSEVAGNSLSILMEKHRVRRRTLLQHSSLLELLELPSLMDACVRSHLYEEGLSIASFANTLERRHLINKDVKNTIVENVVNDVRKREGDLRRDLLNRLRADVTMPQCLEIVTALRRLNGVELERRSRMNSTQSLDLEKMHGNMELRLQVNFLEARDVWLEGTTSMANNPGLSLPIKGKRGAMKGSSEKLLDGIDLYRTRCFEIASQFLAIFRSSQTATASSKNDDHAYQLFSMWTTRRINTFLQDHLASKCLPQISDTATLRDALESVTFFATSMGRVGADFSPMLQTYFQPCLVSIVTSHWMDGLNVLDNTLKVCRDTGIASPLYSNRDVTSSGNQIFGDAKDEYDPTHKRKTPAPPRQLLAHPPLARLVNSFLIGLNELRRCLLACAFPKLRAIFQKDFLDKAKQYLVQNERAVLTPGFLNKKGEAGKLRSVAINLKEEFESCVEPYLTGALDVALGSFNKIQKNVDEVEETIAFEEEEQEEQNMNVVEVDTIQQSEVIDDAAFVPAPEMDTNGAINQAETIEEKLENMKVEEYLEED